MNASGTTSRLLWVDPAAELLAEQRASLAAAGLEPVCLGHDAVPGAVLAGARGMSAAAVSSALSAAGLSEIGRAHV